MTKITIDVDNGDMENLIKGTGSFGSFELINLCIEAYKAQRPSKVERCMAQLVFVNGMSFDDSENRAILTKYMGEK